MSWLFFKGRRNKTVSVVWWGELLECWVWGRERGLGKRSLYSNLEVLGTEVGLRGWGWVGLGLPSKGFCLFRAVGSWLKVRGGEGRGTGVWGSVETRKGRNPLNNVRTEVGAGLPLYTGSTWTCCLSSSHSLCKTLKGRKVKLSWLLSAPSSLRTMGSQKGNYQEQIVRLEPEIIPLRLPIVWWM